MPAKFQLLPVGALSLCVFLSCLPMAGGAELSSSPSAEVRVVDGRLQYADGREVNLWGANFQPMMSFEHAVRMEQQGILTPPELDGLVQAAADGFDQLEALGVQAIRIHAMPADFTDSKGGLLETVWLQTMDFTMAEAARRGLRVYLTLINHLDHDGQQVPYNRQSFAARHSRAEWMYDPAVVEESEHYIRSLLNRVNPFDANRKYKDNPALILLEPVNEPHYPNREEVKKSDGMNRAYRAWLEEKRLADSASHFTEWRRSATLAYLNRMHHLLRGEGLSQPVVWNCGWPRLIQKNKDVFEAISQSKVEAVSFCLYPGQDDLADPFWKNLRDLSDVNYLPYLQEVSDREDWLGWLRGDAFAKKAKVVYEYETFCNTTGYLYPAMAKLFRSLGAQVAMQWTYALPAYTRHLGGSHVFNLEATPHKAASFLLAGEVFRRLPIHVPYQTESPTTDRFDGVAISFEKRLAAGVFDTTVYYTNTLPDGFLSLPESPTRITGVGNSPYVTTDSNGLYEIDLSSKPPRLRLTPQWNDLKPHWLENFSKNPRVELDRQSVRDLKLTLPGQSGRTVTAPADFHWVDFP